MLAQQKLQKEYLLAHKRHKMEVNCYDFRLTDSIEERKNKEARYLTKKTIGEKPLMDKLIEVAYQIQNSKQLTDAGLVLFEEALQRTDIRVMCHYSGRLMCSLSFCDNRAGDLFLKLSEHRSATVRKNIVLNMLYEPAKPIMDAILEKGLTDKSAVVRRKAADVIGRNDLKYFEKKLKAALETETDEKTKEEMKYSLYWLLNDYELIKYDTGGYSLTVKIKEGDMGITLNEEDIVNLDSIVADLKGQLERYYNRNT